MLLICILYCLKIRMLDGDGENADAAVELLNN